MGTIGLMRFALVAVIVAGIAVIAAVVIFSADEPVVVDERSGVLNGVRFGESEAEVRARLGDPTDTDDGVFPEGADYTGPPSIPSPQSDQRRPPRKSTHLHYDDAAYIVSPTAGVFAMASLADGARTRAGVGVGDRLALVRERYDDVTCGEATAGEAVFGGEDPVYPWCRTKLGGIRVFFGEDPIQSITLLRTGSSEK